MSQLRIHCVLSDSGSSSLFFLIQSVGEVITHHIAQRGLTCPESREASGGAMTHLRAGYGCGCQEGAWEKQRPWGRPGVEEDENQQCGQRAGQERGKVVVR